ncbi:MAG: LITAF-like zinc ribbon domain-containing protein, partial [Fimbriiglobus sp.]
MTTYHEAQADCPHCNRLVLARSEGQNHLLHLLAFIFLCGVWSLPWAIMTALSRPKWLCPRCGTWCTDGPRTTWDRTLAIWWLVANAAILGGVLVFFGVSVLSLRIELYRAEARRAEAELAAEQAA